MAVCGIDWGLDFLRRERLRLGMGSAGGCRARAGSFRVSRGGAEVVVLRRIRRGFGVCCGRMGKS